MATRLRPIPKEPKLDTVYLAFLILMHTHNTAKSFLDIFEKIRKKARGASTHEQQDLLRAMLLFASAGLDSMIKQLVRDVLPIIIRQGDVGVLNQFEKFAVSDLKIKSIDATLGNLDVKTLASLIVADSPKEALIKRLVDFLTSDSLQSPNQLYRVASYFGITNRELWDDDKSLREVFCIRNKISHEMDIDFKQPRRNRCPRRKKEMINNVNILLEVSNRFLSIVESKLPKGTQPAK